MVALAAAAFTATFSVPALALKTLMVEHPVIATGDVLVHPGAANGAQVAQPFRADELAVGAAAQLFPKGKTDNPNNLVQVIRLAPGGGTAGLVAFSAICTHLGCTVFEKLSRDGLIACPCHGSRFDPTRQGAVAKGPADRALPSLPIAAGPDGTIVVAGPFTGPIGPQ